jgi:hypothetical protein
VHEATVLHARRGLCICTHRGACRRLAAWELNSMWPR